jgi:hypothetical protein
MNRSDIVDAWLAHRDGEALSPARQRELVAALDADPELKRSLLDEAEIDGLLRARVTVRRGEALVASVRTMIAATVDAPVFAERMRRRLARPSSRRRVVVHHSFNPVALAAMLLMACGIAVLAALATRPAANDGAAPAAESSTATPIASRPTIDHALPTLADLEGGAAAQRDIGSLSAGTRLRPGDLIAGNAGRAVLTWDDGTRVEVLSRATVTVGAAAPGKRLTLGGGRIAASAAHQPDGAPFVLRTGEAEVTVVGTRFHLGSREGETRLDVDEGAVRLAAGGKEVLVRTGENGIADAAGARLGPPVRFAWHPEDGVALLKNGTLVDGPDGRRCLKAMQPSEPDSRVVSVTIEHGTDLFRITPETTIEWTVWIGPGARWAGVLISDFTDKRAAQVSIPLDPRGQWRRMRCHLSDFERVPRELLRAGDIAQSFLVQALPAESSELYVDEVLVSEGDAR